MGVDPEFAKIEADAARIIASGRKTMAQLAEDGVMLMGARTAMAVAQSVIDSGCSSMPDMWREVIRIIKANHME